MTKLYNVILSDANGKESNIIVKDEHLDDYLYHAGFSVKDCYYVGELYEVEPICHKERDWIWLNKTDLNNYTIGHLKLEV